MSLKANTEGLRADINNFHRSQMKKQERIWSFKKWSIQRHLNIISPVPLDSTETLIRQVKGTEMSIEDRKQKEKCYQGRNMGMDTWNLDLKHNSLPSWFTLGVFIWSVTSMSNCWNLFPSSIVFCALLWAARNLKYFKLNELQTPEQNPADPSNDMTRSHNIKH